MSFDWKDYIKLADELINRKIESCLRSGISRAYYGVFCIVRNRAGYKNNTESNVHKRVIEYYKNSKDQNEKYIGNVLDELRRNRNKADYNEDEVINYELAKRVLIKSNIILKKLNL